MCNVDDRAKDILFLYSKGIKENKIKGHNSDEKIKSFSISIKSIKFIPESLNSKNKEQGNTVRNSEKTDKDL